MSDLLRYKREAAERTWAATTEENHIEFARKAVAGWPNWKKRVFEGGQSMSNRCGVCNYDVPIDHEQIMLIEADGSLTSYHMGCEGQAKHIRACPDCGHHRLLCDECKEAEAQ